MSSVSTTLQNLYGDRTLTRATSNLNAGKGAGAYGAASSGSTASSGRVVSDTISLSPQAAGLAQRGPTGTAADAARIQRAIAMAADPRGLEATLKETSNSTDPVRLDQAAKAKAHVAEGGNSRNPNPFEGRARSELAAIVYDESGTFTMAERISAYWEINRQEEERFRPLIAAAQSTGDHRAYYRECLKYFDEMSPIEQAQMSGYREAIANYLREEELEHGKLSDADPAQSKSFADVTSDARALLDKAYAEGRPFDPVHASQDDWDRVFGQLDRRSLHAVASNSGGKFTADEQDIARSMMARQQGQAMGLYGPMGTDTMLTDPSAGFAAGIRFLDSVSPEEQASMDWKVQRASMQWSYESTFDQHHAGEKKEDFTIDDPIVNMLVKGFRSMETQEPRSMTNGTYVEDVEDLKNMPIFDNGHFADELDTAIAQYQARQEASANQD